MIGVAPLSANATRDAGRSAAGPSQTSLAASLNRVASFVAASLGAPIAFVAYDDDGTQGICTHGAVPALGSWAALVDLALRRRARFPLFAGVPLVTDQGERLGAIGVMDRSKRTLTSDEAVILADLADCAVERILHERFRRAADTAASELGAIIAASPSAIVTARRDGTVVTWNRSAESLFGWTGPETIGRRSRVLPEELRLHADDLLGRVNAGGSVQAERTYRFHKSGRRLETEVSAAPMRDRDGAIVGGVFVHHDITRTVRERENERNLFEILELAARDAPRAVLFERLVANVERAVPGAAVAILGVEDRRLRHLAAGALISPALRSRIDGVEIGPLAGSCGAAAFFNETVIAADIATHPNWQNIGSLALDAGLRSCWSVPVCIGSEVIGTTACYVSEARTPEGWELRTLHEAAHVTSIVLASHASREKLRALALHDSLTGLPNRKSFEDQLSQAIVEAKRDGRRLAVGLFDMDRFKVINDNLGHAVGDQILGEVASRVARSMRPCDVVARLGGDEFVLFLRDVGDRENGRAIAERALAGLAQSFAPAGEEIFVRASLGLSFFPDDAQEASQLMKLADAAMYSAKGRVGIACHEGGVPSFGGPSPLRLESELTRALERGELSLAYQPIVNVADRSTFGAEALLRWAHPELGNVPPAQFIGLAEDTGLIIPIGAWVLREACRFSRHWSECGGAGRISVNVSPRQFESRTFVRTVVEALRESGIPARHLYLEITEGLIMRSPEAAAATLAELRALGVQSMIDDFGSGYSSLSYLKRFPIGTLKIDRSFISEIGTGDAAASDEAIVLAGVALGAALKLNVIAEGVETLEQAAFLEHVGCGFAQGYYYARPMPGPALLARTT